MRAPVIGCCALATGGSMQTDANAKMAISKILLGIESQRTKRAIKLLLDSPWGAGSARFCCKRFYTFKCPLPSGRRRSRRSAETQVIRIFLQVKHDLVLPNQQKSKLKKIA